MVKFYNTESLRIIYIVSENSCTLAGFCVLYSSFQSFLQSMSCEDIIAEYCIGEMDTELMSFTKNLLKTRSILRSRDDQDIADPCIHQYRHGIVDHGFIIDWQKLFGCYHCKRIKACAGTAC